MDLMTDVKPPPSSRRTHLPAGIKLVRAFAGLLGVAVARRRKATRLSRRELPMIPEMVNHGCRLCRPQLTFRHSDLADGLHQSRPAYRGHGCLGAPEVQANGTGAA